MTLDCEFNPVENRPLTLKEYRDGLSHAKAVYMLGREEQLAVCEHCAEIPLLVKKYKIKKMIEE